LFGILDANKRECGAMLRYANKMPLTKDRRRSSARREAAIRVHLRSSQDLSYRRDAPAKIKSGRSE